MTTPEDTYADFEGNESFNSLVKKHHVAPTTLRQWWLAHFGAVLVAERGKRIQSASAVITGRSRKGATLVYKTLTDTCCRCGVAMTLTVLQKAMTKRVICEPCEAQERGVDRYCPVCGFGCIGNKGLSTHMHRPGVTDPEGHKQYLEQKSQEEEAARFEGKEEGTDYVVCRLCGQRDTWLGRHLKAAHQMGAEDYRIQFSGALVSSKSTSEKRSKALVAYSRAHPTAGQKKTVLCSSCDLPHDVGWSFSLIIHDNRCDDCKAREEELAEETYWEGKTEREDYAVCQVCGHKANNLNSHIMSEHPELVGKYVVVYPGSLISSLKSPIRDKSKNVGSQHTAETKHLMSVNAGRWNKGLTKETDERVACGAEARKGYPGWAKGLTKETDPRIAALAEKLSALRLGVPHEAARVVLTTEDFLPYRLKNGKVVVGWASAGLGYSVPTVTREAKRLGLPTYSKCVTQTALVAQLAILLGGATFQQEWSSSCYRNPPTDHPFRFDGYFPDHKLLVEFEGFCHYTFPSVYFPLGREVEYAAMQERDREKVRQVKKAGEFQLLVIHESEPFADPGYLTQRLRDLGFQVTLPE